MKRDFLLCIGLGLLLASPAIAQDAKKGESDGTTVTVDTMTWEKYATPGEGHAALKPIAGSWSASVKTWMQPGAPAQESTATAEAQWLMGGRYLQEDVKGTIGGMAFEGRGVVGYDNLKKKYVGTWIDNMGTGIMTSEGAYDAATKTFTNTSEISDPQSGKTIKEREVLRIVSDAKMVRQMWTKGRDGKEFKSMEITYTRKATASAK
jgi:hypothetical protein